MLQTTPKSERSIRSYQIRGGRVTAGQQRALTQYWPQYGLEIEQQDKAYHYKPLEYRHIFQRSAPIVLEIGFGMGDSLLDMATNETDKDFIGIEVHPPGVGRLLNSAAQLGIGNLKVFMADAIDVLKYCIPDNSIDRIQIYFPDPWHKKKHHKRRLIQPLFIEHLIAKLKIGGNLHIATDWQQYAEHILDTLQANEILSNRSTTDTYVAKPNYRPITKFERRALRLGHPIRDIIFYKREPLAIFA